MNTSRTVPILIFSIFFALVSQIGFPFTVSAQSQFDQTATTNTSQHTIIWPQIVAQSAYVYDPISNTVLYTKDPDSVRPIASLTKLMTAAVADNIVHQSEYIANKTIKTVKHKDENRSDIALKTGTSWYINDLLKYMLIGSSNKAAETLASEMIPRSSFMSLMNFEARKLGLSNTRFNNPSGLTTTSTVLRKKVTTPGGVSTAKEVATMLWKIIEQHPGLLEITQVQGGSFSNGTDSFGIQNTNKIIKDLPIVVGKTGFTDISGGNLAVVLQKTPRSHAYVIVVLGSTEEDRFKDVAALAEVALRIDAEKYPHIR